MKEDLTPHAGDYAYDRDDTPEKEIDLLQLALKLWQNRKKLVIWSFCGALLGLVVAFSIPREYTTTVKLAPELNVDKNSGAQSLSSLASLAGINLTNGANIDAVYPALYPEVVASVPFLTGLFDIEVHTKGTKDDPSRTMTVREFLEEDTKSPWWGTVMGLPFKLIGLLRSSDDEEGEGHKLNNFQLTQDETDLVEALSKRVTAATDQKTMVVTIDVSMQDPVVSATLADSVVTRLQTFITEYRTNKARQDLDYIQTLNQEAKDNYYKAQQRYADYLDRNQGLAFHSAQTIRERLENEATLAFNLYNSTATQVQRAKAKVQETTPAYAVITPATVPIKPSAPRKILILIGFTFLAFVACAAWILFVQPFIEQHRDQVFAKATDTPADDQSNNP